jgi:PIN domain nuclease of toxin-antitoxin system
MKILLDTHTLIWFTEGSPLLTLAARNAIEDNKNIKYVSLISLWEMTIKISLGKLTTKLSITALHEYLLSHGVQVLPLQLAHLLTLANLPFHHKDPFDRLLIAQAQTENMILVSADENIKLYTVQILW